MKKTVLSLLFILLMQLCFPQVSVKISFPESQYDSVFVKGFAKHQTTQELKAAFSKDVTLKDSKSLKPGMYNILGDSTSVGVLLVSSEKKQDFSLIAKEKEVIFLNSPENTAYYEYLDNIRAFNKRLDSLNRMFEDAKKSMPQYMLKVFVDSLSANARKINNEMREYQTETAKANSKNLLGSVVGTSTYLPDPPEDVVGNRRLFQEYYVEHFFDNFTWNDPRIFNTPIAEEKFSEYCNLIYQFDNPDFDKFVVAALNKAKVNQQSYEYFFDALERVLGKNISPYKVEHTYIAMLKDALEYPKLDEDRQRRYKRELGFIDKNMNGTVIPNFNFVTATGDTTSIYDVNSEYTLLYLQHPTCPTCHQVRNRMKDFDMLNKAIKAGKLTVVMIYFEDDPQVWDNYIHSSEINMNYMQGWNYDKTIDEQDLFDTRTIPFMFLLDKDKKVVKKDILVNEIEPYIEHLHIY